MKMVSSESMKKHEGVSYVDAQCIIESKVFKMADLKAVAEIPYRDLVEQVDHVVRELVAKYAFDLNEGALKRLVEAVADNLVRKSRLVAA